MILLFLPFAGEQWQKLPLLSIFQGRVANFATVEKFSGKGGRNCHSRRVLLQETSAGKTCQILL